MVWIHTAFVIACAEIDIWFDVASLGDDDALDCMILL